MSTAILAFAAFVIVTTEFLIVGLLPALARDLAISVATAGQLVTAFAVVVMAFGPFLTAWLVNVDRKRLFIAILMLFAVSNAVAAMAANFWILAVARLLPASAVQTNASRPLRRSDGSMEQCIVEIESTVYGKFSRNKTGIRR